MGAITALTDITTLELTLCKRGQNNKRFALKKSAENRMPTLLDELGPVLDVETDNEDKIEEIFKSLSPKGESAVKGAMRLLAGYKDELPKDVMTGLSGLAGFGSPVAKAGSINPMVELAELKKKLAKMEAERAKAGKAAGAPPAAPASPIKKSDGTYDFGDDVPDGVKVQLTALWKAKTDSDDRAALSDARAIEADQKLNAERNDRLRKDFIAKSATEYSHIPGESDELGSELLELHTASPDVAIKIEKRLAAADKLIAEGELFAERGTAGGGMQTSGAWAKITKMAKSIVQKSADGLTEAAAIDRVISENPELYTDYLNENPAQTGRRS